MKRGQEEIVGFVAIIILLAIVFLVFIVFSLSKPTEDVRANTDVYYFLQSSMEVTSTCATGFDANYLKVSDLFIACQQNRACLSGEPACKSLNNTVIELLDQGFPVDGERKTQGYSFEARYERNVSSETQQGTRFMELKQGNCTQSVRGASYTVPTSPGVVIVKLEVC